MGVVFAVVVGLLACSGVGSGPATTRHRAGDLNPDIPGRLLFVDNDRAYTMDISTGRYEQIPQTDWRSQVDRYKYARGIADFQISPRADGQTFLLTVENCRGGPLYHASCIAVQDYQGNYLSTLVIDGDADSSAKPAPDGEHFALFRDLQRDWLEIYDAKGNLVSDYERPSCDFDWLPGGRLVYPKKGDGRTFVITAPLEATPKVVWSLPDELPEGGIARLAVAPDGHHVAFTYRTAGTLVSESAQLLVIDVDDGSLRRVATTPDGPSGDAFHHFAWSPDGRWLAVLEGGFVGHDKYNPGKAPKLYVVPANVEGQTFVVSPDDDERSPQVIKLQRRLELDDPSSRTTDGFSRWDFDWLPE